MLPRWLSVTYIYFMIFIIYIIFLLITGCGQKNTNSKQALSVPEEILSLYKQNCLQCHGEQLEGRMGPASNLQTVGNRLVKEKILQRIKAGGGHMPAFADRLPATKIEKLASWLANKK